MCLRDDVAGEVVESIATQNLARTISTMVLLSVGAFLCALLPVNAVSVGLRQQDVAWPHQPRYYHLPPLREQAEIQDAWTKERLESIPGLLRKYNVSAWLVCTYLCI